MNIRTCRRCHRPQDACECGGSLAIAERDYGLVPLSLCVNSPTTPIGLGGYDRPLELIENAEEILAQYRDSRYPWLVCAYCESRVRFRKLADALTWFRTHTCSGEGVDPDEWSRTAHKTSGVPITPA